MPGPLAGLKVIEMAGLGPAPFCAMLLADMGASVLRIARPGTPVRSSDVLARSRPTVEVDLRTEAGVQAVLDMVESADVLVEGFRPGVMERLGLGPDACFARRPQLVYGRMTGWGQEGPLSQAAGHDINYIALSGVLNAIGAKDGPPLPPINLVGDFGGGAMFLAFGVLAAVLEARTSGQGQVVDAAMTDGSALLAAMVFGFRAAGKWSGARGENLLDGGAPFYATYECADGKYIAVGALEPQFYRALLQRCGIDELWIHEGQNDPAKWPQMREKFASLFRTRTRDEWCALLDDVDACVAPVLGWDEAPQHPHNRSRASFVDLAGVTQPAPAPRFSRTPAQAHTATVLSLEEAMAQWRVTARR